MVGKNFFFSQLKVLFHCLLNSIVFYDKSLLIISLHLKGHFFLAVFKSFSFPLTINSSPMMCLGVDLLGFF